MPFDSKSAAEAGRKGGPNRWRGKDPATRRTEPLFLKLSPDEMAMIADKASSTGLSRAELVVRAIGKYGA